MRWIAGAAVVLLAGVVYWVYAGSATGAETGATENSDTAADSGPAGTAIAGAAHGANGHFPANRLEHESSPYLLLHAHNPVDWYPWGPEAFERARSEDKPIFLSVGYSTCYWCHVMERLVFSNAEIAATMNKWFINIKVDREERPDLDRIYMTATNLINRRGGWPNSLFLTPDLEPFFAGTYFPPEDAHGRPGFPTILAAMHDYWVDRRPEVVEVAERMTAAIRQLEAAQQEPPTDPDTVLVHRAAAAIKGRYDAANGGFGGAPKFPPSMRLAFLLDAFEQEGDQRALEIVEHTLAAMSNGGMYDQVGGGFHRYSTDARWRVPHFEKMLYNQADLVRVYARAYRLTGDERWRAVVEDVLAYATREMTSAEGAFFSALDAETEAEEGKYYVWTEVEIRQALGPDSDVFFAVYDLAPMSEGEGRVLFRARELRDVADELGLEVAVLKEQIDQMRVRLRKVRDRRAYPLLDDKNLTAWNGMMIAAYAEASVSLGDEAYQDAAARAARFILARLGSSDGGLKRVSRGETVKHDGYLEDYAYLSEGLLALYLASEEEEWLAAARRTVDAMLRRLWDEEGTGGFFYTEGGADLIVRSKSGQDSALPSGNAVAALALMSLATATGEQVYLDRAREVLRSFGGAMQARPGGFTHMISAARRYLTTDWSAMSRKSPEPAGVTGAGTTPAFQTSTYTGAQVSLPWVDAAGGRGTAGGSLSESILSVSAALADSTPAPGDVVSASVFLEIVDGWHVNANPAASEWLIPTSVTVGADIPVALSQVHYPPGESLYLAGLEETLSVYSGLVVLKVDLVVDPKAQVGTSGEVRLLVTYQACDDERCLAPAEGVAVVDLTVGGREQGD
jgi:uncharacterized protein YyaL (SSP411 family)